MAGKWLGRHKFNEGDIQIYESKEHRQNFIDSIGTRKPTICPATVGHRSATICQLSGIAQRLGRAVKWDPKAVQISDDKQASCGDAGPSAT